MTCCYIDWYDKWPEEAILSIGIKEISTIDNPAIIKLRFIDHLYIKQHFKYFHSKIFNNLTKKKKLLNLMSIFACACWGNVYSEF